MLSAAPCTACHHFWFVKGFEDYLVADIDLPMGKRRRISESSDSSSSSEEERRYLRRKVKKLQKQIRRQDGRSNDEYYVDSDNEGVGDDIQVDQSDVDPLCDDTHNIFLPEHDGEHRSLRIFSCGEISQSPPVEATKSSCGGNKVLLWRQQSPPVEATKSSCGGNKVLLWRQ
nr:unnamed protein product [Callosobruchus chinensis]